MDYIGDGHPTFSESLEYVNIYYWVYDSSQESLDPSTYICSHNLIILSYIFTYHMDGYGWLTFITLK